MKPIPTSSHHLSNNFALGLLNAFEEVLGKSGVDTLINQANLQDLIANYPPNNLEKEFAYTYVSSLIQALDDLYGTRGGRGLGIRVGRTIYSETLRNIGVLAGTEDDEYKQLPVQGKVELGLLGLARVFSFVSDRYPILEESDHEYTFSIQECPFCWDRKDLDTPSCFILLGILQESLYWFSGGGEFHVSETHCSARGDIVCEFSIQKN